MLHAPRRTNEPAALLALDRLDILDSEGGPALDALVRTASLVCQTPVAFLGLIDAERQWFKASVGLAGIQDMAREETFCAHTVLTENLIEVPDTTLDPRWAGTPLSIGGVAVRFYAGEPLRLTGGESIGTLCVIDTQPRQLSETQREVLKNLAFIAAQALEGRRALREIVDIQTASQANNRAIEEERRDLQTLLDAIPSQIGFWDTHLCNKLANRAYETWFGIEHAHIAGKHMRQVLGDALYERSRSKLEAALSGTAQSFYEAEVPTPDGAGKRHAQVNYLPHIVDGEVRGLFTLMNDVTEFVDVRHQLAATQREGQAILQTLHDHAIISVADRSGRITEVNHNFCKVSGFSRDELLGQTHHLVNSGTHPPTFWRDIWRQISNGQSWRGEICNRAKSGDLYWVDSVIAPLTDANGRVEKYISIRTDISPRKRIKAELERVNERFSVAATAAGLGFWDFDLAQNSLRWDDQMHAMYGCERTEGAQLYALWANRLHPEDRERSESEVRDAINGVRPFDTEFRIVRGDGEVRHLRAVARVMMDQDGVPHRMFGVNFDITDKKRTELNLVGTSTFLRSVLGATSEALIVGFKPDGRINFFNSGAERLLGFSAGEVVGSLSVLKLIDKDEVRAWARQGAVRAAHATPITLADMLASSLGETHDWTFIRKDEGRVPVSLTLTAMRDDQGGLIGYLGVGNDVTEQRARDKELRAAVHAAREASQAKSQFLANMSHEIRTPMNAVIGLSYLLDRTDLDGEQRDLLGKIQIAGKALLGIINDILDISKIEARKMGIERAPFNLSSLLYELSTMAGAQADAKGVGMHTRISEDLPEVLEGDVVRLRQVLLNLLTNAIKFTERGDVSLGVSVVRQSGPSVRLRFEVRDQGIGIPPEKLKSLFSPFVQADASTTRRFGGTGLGLSIVKQLVDLMGGTVEVESEGGKGSTFWVELDLQVCEHFIPEIDFSAASTEGERLKGVRILVADDSEINLEVARRILEIEGAKVMIARDGQEAVDLLLADPKSADVVLMDVQMPVLDGHDATRLIRQGLGLKRLPIIALTAGVSHEERNLLRSTGMNDIVGKPFDPTELVQSIRRHLAETGNVIVGSREGSHASVPDTPPWPHVEGIDTADARTRLRGDADLFLSMLRRVFCDAADLATFQVQASDMPAKGPLAALLHKLKGAAGTLGATEVHDCASDAERACLAGRWDEALHLTNELAKKLHRLQRSAQPVMDRQAHVSPPAPLEEGAAMDAPALEGLLQLLRTHDLAAVDRFGDLYGSIRRRMGHEQFLFVNEQVANLQFGEAARHLAAFSWALETPQM
jgi:PAS domain S-box-containing protein